MADGPIYRRVEEALIDTEVVVVGVAERSTRAPSKGAPAGADEWTVAITDDLGAQVGGSIDMVAVAVDLQAEPCRPGVVEGRDSLFLLSNGRGSDESLVHYPIAVLVETADGGYADVMRGLGMPDLPPDLGTAAELFREHNARS
ncbi:hypothetical protein ACI3EY_01555 [Ornithinimicrobium sp. LYQ92]|uniref:hypothetical protein n=1 Tax=Serinicoccus sp. LYQ92 TaxID=3378798 RepID=UPI003852FC52